MLKVVFDANIYISGIFWKGKPRQLIHLAKEEELLVYTSQPLLKELKEVITRRDKVFKLSLTQAQKVIEDILRYAILTIPAKRLNVVRIDSADNRVLECALAVRVDYIVTGDEHLLSLKSYKGITILNAKEFLKVQSTGMKRR